MKRISATADQIERMNELANGQLYTQKAFLLNYFDAECIILEIKISYNLFQIREPYSGKYRHIWKSLMPKGYKMHKLPPVPKIPQVPKRFDKYRDRISEQCYEDLLWLTTYKKEKNPSGYPPKCNRRFNMLDKSIVYSQRVRLQVQLVYALANEQSLHEFHKNVRRKVIAEENGLLH